MSFKSAHAGLLYACMKRAIVFIVVVTSALTGCTNGTARMASEVISNTVSFIPSQSENLENSSSFSPSSQETQEGLIKITTPMLNDKEYIFEKFMWLNAHEFLALQQHDVNDLLYRLVSYNTTDGSERLFFSWEQKQYHNAAIFHAGNRIKVYSDYCLYELDMDGAVVSKTEYKLTYGWFSFNGNYSERIRHGGTYIINAFTNSWLKVFDDTDEVYYHPISLGWSSDGQYLAISKEVMKTIEYPDTKPDSMIVPASVEIIDKDGSPILTIPLEWAFYAEWLDGSHEIVLLRHWKPENPINSLMIVNADSGEKVGSYEFTNSERTFFNIGKPDCFMIIETITYDENGATDECNIYLYNYNKNEKEFLCRLNDYPFKFLFSPDGQQAVVALGYGRDFYLYKYS